MCYRDIEGTVSTIDGSAGYLPLALALQVQKKRREWHAVRGEVEQLLLLAANAANTTASGDGNAPMHVVVGGALRRPSLGGSLGRRNATERLDTVDWNTSETSSEGSLTEAQVSSSNVTAYQTASQRTTYHSSLPPSTSLPSRLAQRYATAHNRLGACTSALAALERYAFSDLRGDQVRRASWGKEEARRVEERAVRKSVGDTVWNAQRAAVGVHEIGDPAGIMARVARQSGLRNCVYSAAAARKPVRNDGGGFAPRIHVWPISPSCASLVLDTHRSSSFADGPVGGHRSKSEDGEDVVPDGTDDDGQGATSDRLQSSLVTAFQDFCDSATDPAPALAFTHSAESFDSSSSSWTDDNSCGDANVDCISPIYEGAAPPIEDALFLFSPKHAVASTHQLAPPCSAYPSPLLDPIDLLPPTCTALPPAVEILHHHHHHHDDDEADGDPVGIRREGIWVDVLSGRRKSGSAAATAPDDMEVAPPGWGGFFGWLQQQQTYFPPAAAAAAC
ncbi:hypothetical protein QFC19_001809 [Naganishia cerealis]|uniref:Uncharacterized protein n=1 Tax=Naganishia cerealis TaxID=610337 RepID=A0ACC2WEG2_9TREE|nr:hypothetical protein QFC19_001809 [Naganishia cerealis]